ncbi:uncharacterized protein LOC128553213 [Mercenaria mercenaria]|uniref:uncharacterized protein LOC128553213 n=1 Tax=Mercenaria mercenaria TaxID=6596 RepID=UPI00234E6786|nr:uncharacterized protein LOC128553213 [Mercenaria mercenaria]
MLVKIYRVRLNICKLCLISLVAGTWIYSVFKINFPADKEYSTDDGNLKGRHLTVPDNSMYKSNNMNVTKLLNDKFLIRNHRKNSLFESPNNSLLKSAEDHSNDRHTETSNSSLQKIDQNNETKSLRDTYSSNNLDQVMSNPVYPLFQSAEEEEFPTADKQVPSIPHIIHQMYAVEMIPEMYVKLVKSFIELNPTWEYRFWTDKSGRRLLQKHHPYLLKVYDDFGSNVKRSDLLRYAVLYEYGGFYADFDVENLRPLNLTTMKYACIVSVEPFEHSNLLHNMAFVMNNAIMSCRAKHPFFKLLLSDLQWADATGHPVVTTGPVYVTDKFMQYNNFGFADVARNKTDWISNSPYFYKGEMKEDDNTSVYIPNSQYFMDNLDPMHLTEDGAITQQCKNVETLPYLKQRACTELNRRKDIRERKKYTFTVHHWYHLWLKNNSTVTGLKKVNISDIVSNCILYNE